MLRRLRLAAIAVAAPVTAAVAAPVEVANPGFEDLYFAGNLPAPFGGDVPATAFPVGGPPAGWAPFGSVGGGNSIGVLNPGVMAEEPQATNYPDGAPKGDNVAILYANGFSGGPEFGIEQTLGHTLLPDTIYTLSVGVGNIASGQSVVEPYASFGFFDLRGFPGYRIELLAGATMIADDPGLLLPDEGTFETSVLTVATAGLGDLVDHPLTIRLVDTNLQDLDDPAVSGLEVNFDAVTLDASPIPPGDYDFDGDVDEDDYDVWAAAYGSTTDLDADGSGDDVVNAVDFTVWRENLTPVSAAVPEPLGAGLLGTLLCLAAAYRR